MMELERVDGRRNERPYDALVYCVVCSQRHSGEDHVKYCPVVECPLHPFRLGPNPPTSKMTADCFDGPDFEKQLEAAMAEMAPIERLGYEPKVMQDLRIAIRNGFLTKITLNESRVGLIMLGACDPDTGAVDINSEEIAQHAGISRQAATKAIHGLEGRGFPLTFKTEPLPTGT